MNVPHFRRGTDDDRWVIPELVHQDMYRIGSLAEALRDAGGTILDCGAHIGVFSTLLAAHGVRQPIEAFEPEPDNYALLARNVAPYLGITARRAAVGRRNEHRVLFDGGETGRWSFVPPGDTAGRRGVRVPVIDLYEHIRGLGEVALLKLDLEGFEAELLGRMPDDVLGRIHLLLTEEHHLPIDHPRLRAAGFEVWFQPRQDPRQHVYRSTRPRAKGPSGRLTGPRPAVPSAGREVVVWRRSDDERPLPAGRPWRTACPAAAELLPSDAVSILDLAGGEGGTEATDATDAWGVVVETVAGDPEGDGVSFETGRFDAIVLGRLLERVRDPLRLLRRARGWSRPGACVVGALSNARHHAIVQRLLEGVWEGAGPDGPRIRFFTRREIEKIFSRAGLAIESLRGVPASGDDHARTRGKVDLGHLQVQGLAPAAEAEFFASDYLVRATARPDDDVGLTSIVVLTHDQLAYTRSCLDSIRLFTDEPYEVIVVDNASTDGTPAYLRSLGGVTLIENPTNRGFPAGANQGIRAARGRQVLLLNNDTVVTTGWLTRMLRALRDDPAVGLVGPCSNRVSGEQQVPVDYDDDLVGLDGFAWDWGRDNDGRREATDRLVGFCLLIRREVIDEIGLLDERFGVGCFEDDDYCRRAAARGHLAVIARDAFVHHFGGRTFVGSGVDFASLMRLNQGLYEEKWRPAAPAGSPAQAPSVCAIPPGPLAFRRGPGGGLLLERRPVAISLCMIVRDNARTIGACLESIRPWVDEMCVVDTGSADETPLIAARLGARVSHSPWRDSFSEARNESLRHATGRWIFWMDSDDTISPENGRKLRALVAEEPGPEVLGFVMQVHCPGPGPDGGLDVTVVDHVKLFRNLPHLRFDGRIHEQILPAIRRSGGETAWTDVFVVHSGYDHSPEGQERKKQRDLSLLALELEERPEHPFTLFNFGMTLADVGEFARAAEFLDRSILRSGEGESHLRKAYALLVYCLGRLGDADAAGDACGKGLRLFPQDAELRFRHAILLHQRGDLAEAAASYLGLLARPAGRYFSSIDTGILGFKARQNLALVYADQGDLDRAEGQWRLITAEVPRYRDGWRGLGETLLRRGRVGEAEELAARLRADDDLRVEGLLLLARAAALSGRAGEAERLFGEASAARPDDPAILETACRALFDMGGTEAEGTLEALLRLRPGDAAAHHNLGTVRSRQGRAGEAAAAYRRSVELRPDSAPTWHLLAQTLRGCGRDAEAAAARREADRLEAAAVGVGGGHPPPDTPERRRTGHG